MNSTSPAGRRYVGRMVPLMVAYVAAILGVTWLFDNRPPEGALRYALAVLPALPIIGVVWAVGLYLREETDEYVRMRLAETSLYATGATLAAASVWGFLEQFETVPHIPLYYAFVFYWAAFGVIQGLRKVLDR